MNHINRFYVTLFALLLPLAGISTSSRAVDIDCRCEEGSVRLSIPGLYYEAYVERAEAPEGPFTYLARGSFGCTEACEFLDEAVMEGTTYWYRMTALPQYGPVLTLGPVEIRTPALPRRMFGSIATPNPFPDLVSIRFSVPAQVAALGPIEARVTILDATGRLVREISSGAAPRGDQEVTWDGRDRDGRQVPSGVYLYSIEIGGNREAGRFVKLN